MGHKISRGDTPGRQTWKEIGNTKTGEKVYIQTGAPDSNGDVISPNCKWNLPANYTIQDHDFPEGMAQAAKPTEEAYGKELKRVTLDVPAEKLAILPPITPPSNYIPWCSRFTEDMLIKIKIERDTQDINFTYAADDADPFLITIPLNYIDEHQPLPPDHDRRPENNLEGCRAFLFWIGAAIALIIALFFTFKHH